jgi:hypothetical protein
VNVRINASALAGPQVAPAVAGIAIYGSPLILLNNPTPTVGFVQSGLAMEGRSPDNSQAGMTTAITSCASPQRAGVIRFAEVFGTAFKTRTVATFVDGNTSPAPVAQNVPGTIYNTESGAFYNPSLTSPIVDFSTVGLASFGTRLQANISAPSGARVWVSLNDAIYSGGNPAPGNSARLIGRAKGPFAAIAATAVLDGLPVAELPVVNGGVSATWEVLGTNPNHLDMLDFVVWVQAGGSGSGWFSGGFAPSPAPSEVGLYVAASSTQPEPRFYQPATSYGLFTTSACRNSTSTVLSPSSSTVTAGGRVTLTANVTGTGGTPTGSVTFLEGAIPMATASLTNGTASIAAPVSAGFHTYSASYAGNGSYGQSTSAAVSVTGVTPPHGVPDLRVSSSASPSFVGQNLVYTATIITGGAAPTGTVTFSDGAQVLGAANAVGGQAVLSTAFAVAGNHDIVATYSGDANYAGATVHFVQTVKP